MLRELQVQIHKKHSRNNDEAPCTLLTTYFHIAPLILVKKALTRFDDDEIGTFCEDKMYLLILQKDSSYVLSFAPITHSFILTR